MSTVYHINFPLTGSYPLVTVDDLTLTYNGNQLKKLEDAADEILNEQSYDFHDGADNATEYAYDSNGNVIRDDNRGLTDITYNVLNLPSHIEVGSDEASEAIRDYIYDGAGKKLGTRSLISYFSGKSLTTYDIQQPCSAEDLDYIGNYGFWNGQLIRINTPYGYITMGTFFPYCHDYQGNIRNNANYYAYGLPVQDSKVSITTPYLYGGKEFYSLKGINLYDFHARTYAPDICRFMQPDPKAGDYHWLSPYSYCGGDPINRIDENGEFWETVWDVGNVIYDVGAAIYNHIIGDHETAKEHWADAAYDTGAAIVPFVPAGASKVTKLGKTADKVSDTSSKMKYADRVSEGKQFETEELQKAIDRGDDVVTQVTIVPLNGKGNVKGNRSRADQLIRDKDGNYSIVETKLTDATPLTPGQNAVGKHIGNNGGEVELRTAINK